MNIWSAEPAPPADAIVCGGRAVDDHGQHTGPPCDRVFRPRWRQTPPVEQARAAGWSIATHNGKQTATCPACRKPDPTILKGLK